MPRPRLARARLFARPSVRRRKWARMCTRKSKLHLISVCSYACSEIMAVSLHIPVYHTGVTLRQAQLCNAHREASMRCMLADRDLVKTQAKQPEHSECSIRVSGICSFSVLQISETPSYTSSDFSTTALGSSDTLASCFWKI